MLKKYFRTARRNLLRHKSIAVINPAGLNIGFTCCMLIALYLQHELRYEDFREKGDRIARVLMEYPSGPGSEYTSVKVAWWAADAWLQDLSYRRPLSWLLFTAAGSIASNPVNSLRSA